MGREQLLIYFVREKLEIEKNFTVKSAENATALEVFCQNQNLTNGLVARKQIKLEKNYSHLEKDKCKYCYSIFALLGYVIFEVTYSF